MLEFGPSRCYEGRAGRSIEASCAAGILREVLLPPSRTMGNACRVVSVYHCYGGGIGNNKEVEDPVVYVYSCTDISI